MSPCYRRTSPRYFLYHAPSAPCSQIPGALCAEICRARATPTALAVEPVRCAKAVYTSRRSPFSAPTNTPTSSPPARCATKPRLSSPTSPLAFARSSSGSRWAMLSRTAFKSRALAATAAPPPSRAANITKRKRTLRRFVVMVRTKVAPEPACARCAIADRDRQKSPPTPAQHARSHRR